MGQYYKPVNLLTREWVYSHGYGNGLKLMEHSYIGNDFVRAVEGLLAPGGRWHKANIVWAGDYADKERDSRGIPKSSTLYGSVSRYKKIKPRIRKAELRYLVNHTHQTYVDLKTIVKHEGTWRIHPLPLLTCDGNGRGGGDYHGERMDLVGAWARCSISMEKTAPYGYQIIAAPFKELL